VQRPLWLGWQRGARMFKRYLLGASWTCRAVLSVDSWTNGGSPGFKPELINPPSSGFKRALSFFAFSTGEGRRKANTRSGAEWDEVDKVPLTNFAWRDGLAPGRTLDLTEDCILARRVPEGEKSPAVFAGKPKLSHCE
jgi:hypothetical protein